MKCGKKALALALALALCCVPACKDSGNESGSESGTETQAGLFQSADLAAFSGDGAVSTFLGGGFYDGVIKNEDEAYAAVWSVYDKIGADETTVLLLQEERSTEENTYYVFYQVDGAVRVYGSVVKLIVDANGKAVGLVSSIVPKLPKSLTTETITAEQAEGIIKNRNQGLGPEMEPIKGATEQTLLGVTPGSDVKSYTWIVYTKNNDLDSEAAYLANYVSGTGTYVASVPVTQPGNEEAQAGATQLFAFDKMKASTWEGKLRHKDGSEETVKLPVLINPETSETYLGDAERKIIVADYADFSYKNTISPSVMKDGTLDNEEALIYYHMIKIYDFFLEMGWKGADGLGTPIVLLMNAVDKKGESVNNASYNGFEKGFQIFSFGRDRKYGDCIDIIAHEYVHGITRSAMTTDLYMNQYGAINEAMSDILGNLAEMALVDKEEGYWIIGENLDAPLRSMKDPHRHEQPAYVWDTYYVPEVASPAEENDFGGVHINSSLLNNLSYQLYQAGMNVEEQLYFWMNVALTMTPRTDFKQLTELLPWCMEQAGYPKYKDVLTKSMKELGYSNTEIPSEIPADKCMIRMKTQDLQPAATAQTMVGIYDADDKVGFLTWPGDQGEVVAVLSGGHRFVLVLFRTDLITKEEKRYYYTSAGNWVETEMTTVSEIGQKAGEDAIIQIAAGETKELKSFE